MTRGGHTEFTPDSILGLAFELGNSSAAPLRTDWANVEAFWDECDARAKRRAAARSNPLAWRINFLIPGPMQEAALRIETDGRVRCTCFDARNSRRTYEDVPQQTTGHFSCCEVHKAAVKAAKERA